MLNHDSIASSFGFTITYRFENSESVTRYFDCDSNAGIWIKTEISVSKYLANASLCVTRPRCIKFAFERKSSRIKGLRLILLICDQTQILCNVAYDIQCII